MVCWFLFYVVLDFMVFICGASVGTNVGDIGLWEVGSRERLVLRNFKVWDLGACSMPLQVCIFFNSVKDASCMINCV